MSDVDYPPHAIVALSPLSLVPIPVAVPFWAVLNLCLAVLAPYLAARFVRRSVRVHQIIYLTLLFLCWSGAKVFLQFSLLTLVLGLAALVQADRRPAWSGILLGLSFMKPQIAAPFFLWTLFTRRWTTVGFSLTVVAGGTLLFCARVHANPAAVAVRYVQILQRSYTGGGAMAGASQLHPILMQIFPRIGDALAAVVAAALLLVICLEGFRVEKTDPRVMYAAPAMAAIWSLLTFYHLTYGFVVLLPAAALLLDGGPVRTRGRALVFWTMQIGLMFDAPGIWRRSSGLFPHTGVADVIVSNVDQLLMVFLFGAMVILVRKIPGTS